MFLLCLVFFYVIQVLRNVYVGLVKYTLHVEVLNSVKIGNGFFGNVHSRYLKKNSDLFRRIAWRNMPIAAMRPMLQHCGAIVGLN